MPYARNTDLPDTVRSALPVAAQSIFLNVVNSQLARDLSEEKAFASAWTAVRRAGYEPSDQGKWRQVEKSDSSLSIPIAKVDEAKRNVFGWASIAVTKSGEVLEDYQGDVIDTADLEEAAYQFNLDFRETGVMHTGEAVGQLIESFMVTPEKLQALGLAEDALPHGWWLGFHVEDDEVFKLVKSGHYSMFSIQGKAVREPV